MSKDSAEVRISERVRAMMNVAPNSVRPAPVPGLYEVVINRSRVFYVDPEVRFLIAGRIFEAATETDLTAKRMEELSRVSLNELPLKDAITVVYGKGERKIAVFTDANCSYCKVLEKSLREIGNVTVYNFIYPILNSREASRNIVCAKNPVSAFQNHMLTGADPAPAVCDDSVLERNLRLGSDLQITGTPHIIFSNGERFAGAMPIDRLREALASQ
ncbi:MAG: DsbC family protein [Duodenibacillus sp.]|nr:DsbC family protein [Duodenibacillus sp.]